MREDTDPGGAGMSAISSRVLAVGDHFIAAGLYADALRAIDPAADVRLVDWAGDKSAQHHAQQQMEWHGVTAAPVPAEVIDAVGDAEVLALHFAPVPAVLLDAGTSLRAVVVARAGLENVDVDAASRNGVAVCGVAGRNASGVAELALGMMISEGRDVARSDAMIRAGGWRPDAAPPGREVGDSTVGMIGFGNVGHHLAERLRGFGVRLLVADPYLDAERLASYDRAEQTDLDTVFRESDFIVVQARLTKETERFIGAAQFALMKPTAYFVNVARSRLVDYGALYDVLSTGRIAGAGLDVYDDEPLAADSPWRRLPNTTMTPHFAGDTDVTNQRSTRLVADKIRELDTTGRIADAANAAALGWV